MGRGSRILATLGLSVLIAALVLAWAHRRSGGELAAATMGAASARDPGSAGSGAAPAPPALEPEERTQPPTHGREPQRWRLRGEVRGPDDEFGVLATRVGRAGEVLERRELPLERRAGHRFELADLTPGHWIVAPFAPGFELVFRRHFEQADEGLWLYQLTPEVTAIPPPAFVSGRVELPTGELALDASILCWRAAEFESSPSELALARAASTEQGRFTLQLEAGDWWLMARAKGWNDSVPVRVTYVEGFEVQDVRLQLQPPRRVRFLVAAEIPTRPRSLEFSWTAEGGKDSGTATGLEGIEFEVPISGADTVEWTVTCPPDERWVGRVSFESKERSPLVRLERLPASPVHLVVSNGFLLGNCEAVAGEPALGLQPAVPARFDETSGRLEFELPRPGRWLLRSGPAESAFRIDVPDVPVHETQGPQHPNCDY